jgi:hypothetical protein
LEIVRVNPCDLSGDLCIGSRADRRAFYLQSAVRKLKFCKFAHIRPGGCIEFIKTTFKDDALVQVPAEARCASETCPNARLEFEGAIILEPVKGSYTLYFCSIDCIENYGLRTTQTMFETLLTEAAAALLDEELIEEEVHEEEASQSQSSNRGRGGRGAATSGRGRGRGGRGRASRPRASQRKE